MCTKCEKNSSCQGGLCKPKPPLSCPDGFAEYGGKCREFGGWFVEDGDTPNCNELSGDGCQCPDGFVQKSLSPLSEGSKTLSFCVPDGAPSGAWGGAYVKTSTNPAAQCFGVNNPLSNTCGCPAGWDVYPEIVLGTPDATRVLYMCLQPGAPGATVVGGYARFDDTTKKHSTNAGKNGCFFDSMDDYKCVCPPGSKAVSVPALAPVQTQDDEPPNSASARVAICVKE